jgi:hypothetical protein
MFGIKLSLVEISKRIKKEIIYLISNINANTSQYYYS